MAVRTWANSLGIAAGAGLLAGAGQLGVVYGLGVVRWDRDFTSGAPWHAQLTWVSFAAMVAVVIGALAGAWQARRLRQQPSLALSTALAFAAALGSTVILPLVGRPAGAAHLAESGNPGLSAVLVAGVGLLVGIVAAVAVLSVPPVSGSVIATVLWVWAAGLISAVSTLGGGASWANADLGLLSARGGDPEPLRDPDRGRLGAADYGWPEPESVPSEPTAPEPTLAPVETGAAATDVRPADPPAPPPGTRPSGRTRAAKPEPAKPG